MEEICTGLLALESAREYNREEYIKKYTLEHKKQKREYDRVYRLKNADKIKAKNQKYFKLNKAKINRRNVEYWEQHRTDKKEYDKNNRDRANFLKRKRRSEDPIFAMNRTVRSFISRSFRHRKINKPNKTEFILGCSFAEFKHYIELKFESWMTWDNKGKYNGQLNFGWDIDHIIPISSANSVDEIIKLNHYTNLAPMCSYLNRNVKKDKLNFKNEDIPV